MKKYFFLMMLSLSLGQATYAQACDKCKTPDDFHAEDCFTSETFKGKCAQFSSTSQEFGFQSDENKKPVLLALDKTKSIHDNLIELATDSKQKLSALDILFLQDAFNYWKAKLIEIRIRKTAAAIRTETEFQQIKFEKTLSGLEYAILEEGGGAKPEAGKAVQVHYRGYLTNAKIFDESFARGQAFSFTLGRGQVIRGWDEGIALLHEGDRAIFKIPAELGYGSRAMGDKIPANSTLIFEVVLVKAGN